MRDKFTRLVGDRIDEETGVVTLTADRCPYRGQNMDYAHYLLTALFHESWRVEEWEKKEHADMEVFEVDELEAWVPWEARETKYLVHMDTK